MRRSPLFAFDSALLIAAIGFLGACDADLREPRRAEAGIDGALPEAADAALVFEGIRFCSTLAVSETSVTSSMTTFLLREDPANAMASTSTVCAYNGSTSDVGGYAFTNIGAGSTVTGYIADAEADLAAGADVYLRVKTTGNAWRKSKASAGYGGTFLVSDGLGPICHGAVSGASGDGGVTVTDKRNLYIALPAGTDLDTLGVTFTPSAWTTCAGSGVGDQAFANIAMSTPKIWFP